MSRTHKDSPNARNNRPRRGRQRNVSVQAIRRDPPDLKKLSRALIQLALAESAEERDQAPTATPTTPQTSEAAHD